MFEKLPSFLIMFLLSLLPTAVQAGDCNEKCTPPTGKDKLKAFVKIDSNSGRILEGRSRFPADTQIQLVFVNQNPFKYTYRYEIQEREIEAAVILDALQRLGLPTLESDEMPPPPPPAPTPTALPGAPPGCPASMDDLFNQAEEPQKELLDAAQAVRDTLAEQERGIIAFNSFTQSIDTLPDDVTSCKDLCTKGSDVLPKLDTFLQREDKKKLQIFLKAQLAVSRATDLLQSQIESELPNLASDQERQDCTNALKAYKEKAKKLLGLAAASQKTFEESVKKIDALEKNVKAMRDIVKEVLDSDDSFMYVAFLESRPEPTEFEIAVIRKERGKKEEKRVTVTIRAGRSRFSMSAGIGLSFVEQQTFGRQQGLVPTTMTQDDGTVVTGTKLGEIFAVTHRSSESLVAVFQLNGLIKSGRRFSWGWALGATVGEGEGEARNLGYYTGPTFAFIGDQLFFTLAYHQQEVTELGGGFQVGDPIPEGFMGDLPQTTDDKGGLLFTVTYRFR